MLSLEIIAIMKRIFTRLFFITMLIMLAMFTSSISKPLGIFKTKHSVETLQYLKDRDYQMIQKNYKYYYWAATKCDIPIETLIAIHHRESKLYRGYYSFTRNIVVKNLGGPFMLDCGGEGTIEFKANIRYEERRIAKKYNFEGDTRVSHNFTFACLVAADYIKNKARYSLDTEHGVADMFWGYNGRAHKSYFDSSYVSSDPKNSKIMSFTFKGKAKNDVNPGCLVLWKELKNSKKFRAISSAFIESIAK